MLKNLQALKHFLNNHGKALDGFICVVSVLYFLFLEVARIPGLLTSDVSLQLSTVYQFLQGNTFAHVYSTNPFDLSQLTYQLEVQWPHGYPLLIAGVYHFVGDIVLSNIIVTIVFISVFLVSIVVILRHMEANISPVLRAGLLLYWTFIVTPLYTPSEIIALAVLYLALACWMQRVNSKQAMAWMILAGFLIGFGGATRYIYMPYIVILPAVSMILALYYKQWRMVWHAVAIAVSALIPIAITLWYNTTFSGTATRTDVVDGGLHWSNLRLAFPVGSNLAGNWLYISDKLNMNLAPLLWLFSIVILSIVGWVTYRTIAVWLRTRSQANSTVDPLIGFVLFGFFLSGITVSLLFVLSVINEALVAGSITRTFLTNARYYSGISVWLSIMTLLFLTDFANARTTMNRLSRRVLYVGLALMIPGLIIGFLVKGVTVYRALTPLDFYVSESDYAQVNDLYGLLKDAQVDDEPLTVITAYFVHKSQVEHLALLSGNYVYTGILDAQTPISTSQAIDVLLVIPEGLQTESVESQAIEQLIAMYEGEWLGDIDGFTGFYRFRLDP